MITIKRFIVACNLNVNNLRLVISRGLSAFHCIFSSLRLPTIRIHQLHRITPGVLVQVQPVYHTSGVRSGPTSKPGGVVACSVLVQAAFLIPFLS